MLRSIRIALAHRAHRKTVIAADVHRTHPGPGWSILVQIALDSAECAAANRLALAIDPSAITRAF